ncbi:MAG: hypothetical protein ABRQ38_08455 [Candidatus Eremiobacterota bacterium]
MNIIRSYYGYLIITINLLTWALTPDIEVSLRQCLCVTVLLLALSPSLLNLIYRYLKNLASSEKEIDTHFPKIIRIFTPQPDQTQYIAIFLLEPFWLFSRGMAVTCYYMENEFQYPIGIGKVLSIQSDGKIQVAIKNNLTIHEDIFKKLLDNNKDDIENTTIRPYVEIEEVL